MLILGGDDGSFAAADLGPRHPGFCRAILKLDEAGWREIGALPHAVVTTGIARWSAGAAIPGGEDRPGRRSSRVLFLEGLF
ncbi:MAG: hypothetical protein ACPL7M_16300 [Bryobacteraceae bacterium]